jgi:GT2 family glycosyltransferase
MSSVGPTITTIIPTYRRPQLLRRAVRSALAQTYVNVIVHVYDNASGDETAAVVAELAAQDPRVRYHCHPENIGAVANFNHGMQRVETPFFSFLSDDDVLLPEFYASALESFEEYPQAIFSAGTVLFLDGAGRVLHADLASWPREGYFVPPDGMYAMIGNNHPALPGILFRREILTEFGAFDPEVVINDVDLELRVAARFPFVARKRLHAIFVQHATSLSTSNPIPLLLDEWPKVLRNIQGDPKIAPEVRAQAVSALSQYLRGDIYRVGVQRAIARDTTAARRAVGALRDQYGLKRRARRLDRLATVCHWAPPLAWMASLGLRVWHGRHAQAATHLQTQFGGYAKYLDLG